MTELVIGRSPPAAALEGRKFKNMRHFAGTPFKVDDVTKVYLEEDESELGTEIAAAYKAAKIDVQVGLPKRPAAPEAKPEPKPKA